MTRRISLFALFASAWPLHARALLGSLLMASGCALEEGGGFARLEPGTLRAALEIGAARELAENLLLTDQGYRVELSSCRLQLESFELQTLTEGGNGGSERFDPANPPDGYSLCHGGHCHADDGSLPSYDEIQTRLAGGPASWSPVARVALDAELDLLAPSREALTGWEPAEELPEAVIGRAVLRARQLDCVGRIAGARLAEPLPLEVSLPLSKTRLRAALDLAISRDGPERVTPEVRLQIDGTLFDGLDFAARAEAGRVELGGEDAEALEGLVGAAALTVRL